ncbi:hypothetical protein PGTUg99_003683 [Puccinia graminis f. sp. tritici]|uniref:Uncharacterized protein n=1 Tax=Puccinia graminis f. sp. tritici TaxID=56615 RepID=A0A5B0QYH5_PUCGR|nr:hypothetical protein PGTUg99_003683 [Puccinia graminis f. sp. tritici]
MWGRAVWGKRDQASTRKKVGDLVSSSGVGELSIIQDLPSPFCLLVYRANSIGVTMNEVNAWLTSVAWASEPTNGWAWRRRTVADSTLTQVSLSGLEVGVQSTPLRSLTHDRGACVMSAAPAIRTLKFTKYLVTGRTFNQLRQIK